MRGLFASRWWSIGFGVGFVAWGLHVGALAIAPLSLVQAVIAGGLVLLALPAERWFGIALGRREWAGLLLSAAGLTFLVVTASRDASVATGYSESAMIAFEGAALGIGVAMLFSGRGPAAAARSGSILALAAGLLIGVSDVAVKALSESVPGDPQSIVSPWTAIALVASLAALYALARALQTGGPIQTIALSSVAANLAAISGGIVVFGDPVGTDPLGVLARGAAFATVIVAAGLVQGRQAAAGTAAAA